MHQMTRMIESPEDMTRASGQAPASLTLSEFKRLEREGYTESFTAAEKRIFQRLLDEQEHAGGVDEWRDIFAQLDAQKQDEREAAEAERRIFSTAAPSGPDDHLSIWNAAGNPNEAERELNDGRCFVFRGSGLVCHFVPRDIAIELSKGNRRLPGRTWNSVPRDLLAALLGSGGFTPHEVNRHLRRSGPDEEIVGTETTPAPDYERLLSVAAAAVTGCDDTNTLAMWLDAAQENDGGIYEVFALVLEKRLDELGYRFEDDEDVEFEEPEQEQEEEAEGLEGEDVVDAGEDTAESSTPASATAPDDGGTER